MNTGKAIRHFRRRYIGDTKGTMTVIWALIMSSTVVAVGSAYDITKAHTAKSKAQSIADTIALTAAVYVKHNDATPQTDSEGFVHGVSYNLSSVGYDLAPYASTTEGVADNWVTVTYDSDTGHATASISGSTTAAFMSLVGIQAVDFKTSATVKYSVEDLNNSVSIALVLDTSGSMIYYDETDTKRQDAMEVAVVNLMGELTDLVDGQENDGRILRTGMIPYYSSVWSSHVVDMDWGAIDNSAIYALYQGGGTNSSGAMALAKDWMGVEAPYHETETGRDDPKRYVVFMTDGNNNNASYDTATLVECDALKESGVEIYTIGYALNPQTYGSGYYDSNGNEYTYAPPAAEIAKATALLSDCASSADHFKKTSDNTDISTIFENIGADIAENALRISR